MKNLFFCAVFIVMSLMAAGFAAENKQGRFSGAKGKGGSLRASFMISVDDYRTGTKLADALLQKCSLLTAVVTSVQMSEEEVRLALSVDEWLAGKRETESEPLLVSYVRSPNPKISGGNVWQGTNAEVGKKLFLSSCRPLTGEIGFDLVVSNETLFPVIRELIQLETELTADETTILGAARSLGKRQSHVFGGYLMQRIWRLGTIGNPDARALALTEMLGSKNLPESAWPIVREQIQYLVGGNGVLRPETLDELSRRLIASGAGDDKSAASEAILVLVAVTEKGRIDLGRFWDDKNADKLGRNYRDLVFNRISSEERKRFEKQLSPH
jgi:hypothetical protein